MRLARVRFTVRRMMVAVAVAAVLLASTAWLLAARERERQRALIANLPNAISDKREAFARVEVEIEYAARRGAPPDELRGLQRSLLKLRKELTDLQQQLGQ